MPQDPLSVAAPYLGDSSFDPVEAARGLQSDVRAAEMARRKAMREGAKSFEFSSPARWESAAYENLLKEGNALQQVGPRLMMESGGDLKSSPDPMAQKYRDAMSVYTGKLDLYKEQKSQYDDAMKKYVSDKEKGFENLDPEQTYQNILKFKSAPTVEEKQKILDQTGGLLVPRQRRFNIPEMISEYKDDFLKTDKGKTAIPTKDQEFIRKQEWEKVNPESARKFLKFMYNNVPGVKDAVATEKKYDVTADEGTDDLQWMYDKYVDPLVREEVKTDLVNRPGGAGGGRGSDQYTYQEGIKSQLPIDMSKRLTEEEIKERKLTDEEVLKGVREINIENAVPLKNKRVQVSVGKDAIDQRTGKNVEFDENIHFYPRWVGTVYKTTVPTEIDGVKYYVGDYIPTDVALERLGKRFRYAGRQTHVEPVKVVEGVYNTIADTGEKTEKGTLWVPYENIKTDLDREYDNLSGFIEGNDKEGAVDVGNDFNKLFN